MVAYTKSFLLNVSCGNPGFFLQLGTYNSSTQDFSGLIIYPKFDHFWPYFEILTPKCGEKWVIFAQSYTSLTVNNLRRSTFLEKIQTSWKKIFFLKTVPSQTFKKKIEIIYSQGRITQDFWAKIAHFWANFGVIIAKYG